MTTIFREDRSGVIYEYFSALDYWNDILIESWQTVPIRESLDQLEEDVSHLCFALLAVDDLSWDDLGGGGLGSRAQGFRLGHNHLGNGSGGGDNRWLGPLNCLQTLLTLTRSLH